MVAWEGGEKWRWTEVAHRLSGSAKKQWTQTPWNKTSFRWEDALLPPCPPATLAPAPGFPAPLCRGWSQSCDPLQTCTGLISAPRRAPCSRGKAAVLAFSLRGWPLASRPLCTCHVPTGCLSVLHTLSLILTANGRVDASPVLKARKSKVPEALRPPQLRTDGGTRPAVCHSVALSAAPS